LQAVILAGGVGSRLRPFTTNIPKPLIPVGDMPILEVVLRQLKYYGFTDVIMAVNHLAELIMAFFGDGKKWGLKISYSMEDKVLGTAGPLTLIDSLHDDFLVMNGDILTTLNYRHLHDWHLKNGNDASISTYKKELRIDLGVLKTDGDLFLDYIEKPTYDFTVSMGIYMFNKKVVAAIEKERKFDMPELILKLRDTGRKVRCYQGDYYWLDIGRVDDYETAVSIFNDKKKEFLPQ
jgi:NDP-mannose synthase